MSAAEHTVADELEPQRHALLRALFDERVAIAAGDPRRSQSPRVAAEEAQIRGASERRAVEFRNGRACAAQAFARLGVQNAVLPGGDEGEPLWPTGYVGSITHGEAFCAAAVARAHDYSGLGLDVETDLPVSDAFARRVCSPLELRRCSELGAARPLARVVFSAKESVYKLQYPLSRAVLYWGDLEVLLDHGHFSARFLTACPPFRQGEQLLGRWSRGGGVILTGLALERARGSANQNYVNQASL